MVALTLLLFILLACLQSCNTLHLYVIEEAIADSVAVVWLP